MSKPTKVNEKEEVKIVREYPTLLCRGDTVNHSCRAIHNEEDYELFKGLGFIDFDELPEFVETEQDEK